MSAEDELHRRLQDELGDAADPIQPAACGPTDQAGWAAIEGAAAQRGDRRRAAAFVGVAALLLAVLVGGIAALSARGDHSSRVASTGTAPATTRAGADTSVAPTSVPPATGSTGPTAPTSVPTLPGGQLDCGTAYLASGWPTTTAASPLAHQCILSAFASGTLATYGERAQTDGSGGHIQITTYEVTAARQVRRTVDARGAQPAAGVTVSVCTGLVDGPDGQLEASGCS